MTSFPQITKEIKQSVFELRNNPKEFANLIKNNYANFKANNLYHRPGFVPIKTKEGLIGAKNTVKRLRKTSPLPVFTESSGLQNAALHIAYLLSQGVPWEEVSPTRILNDYGLWLGSVVLLIDEGNVTGAEIIQSLLIDDGLDLKTNQDALLNPYFKLIGIGSYPKKGSITLTVLLLASDFTDKTRIDEVVPSEEKLEKHQEIDEWVEDAVKLDCEIVQESSSDRVITRVKQIWHLVDNSLIVTEKLLD